MDADFGGEPKVLCAQCAAIFSGQQKLYSPQDEGEVTWPPPVHHQSVASFESAVRDGCRLCFRVLMELRQDGHPELVPFRHQKLFSCYTLRGDGPKKWEYDLNILVFYPENDTRSQFSDVPRWLTFRQILLSNEQMFRGLGSTDTTHTPRGTNTATKESWEQARGWYEECRRNHAVCNAQRGAAPFFPTRVLDISERDPRLIVVVNSHERQPPRDYATLSHCWGEFPSILRLTTNNLAQLQAGIAWASLPQTFRDAIDAARRLGIGHLWVDSLCILQDSATDWQSEAALMDKVYGNGVLNIMATACRNSHEGLYRDRDPRELAHCSFTASWDGIEPQTLHSLSRGMWDRLIRKAPLNARGWVLQERILSPRALHFGHNQLAWECHEIEACEMHPSGLPHVYENLHSHVKIVEPNAYRDWISTWRRYDPVDHAGYDVWRRIIRLYGTTSVTRQTDRLVALSGLAKRMRSILRDRYLAGLWEHRLAHQLIWHCPPGYGESSSSRRVEGYRAPSWSWASIEGEVDLMMVERHTDPTTLIDIDEVHVTPLSDIDDTAEVMGGHIRLRGCLLQAELLGRDDSAYRYTTKLEVCGKNAYGVVYADEPVTALSTPVVVLPVLHQSNTSLAEHSIHALMLVPVPGRPRGWYSRIGLVSTWASDDADPEAWDYNEAWACMRDRLADASFNDDSLSLEGYARTIMFI